MLDIAPKHLPKNPREALLGLITDAERLVTAGARSIAGHERLREHAITLRRMSRRVPALAALLPAVDALLDAPELHTPAALLSLVARCRRLRASLAEPDARLEGELEPVNESGPWETAAPVRDLVIEVNRIARSERYRKEIAASPQPRRPDLRMAEEMLATLEDGNQKLADSVAEQILPSFGPVLVPELERAGFRADRLADMRRLVALAHLSPAAAKSAIAALDPDLGAYLSRAPAPPTEVRKRPRKRPVAGDEFVDVDDEIPF